MVSEAMAWKPIHSAPRNGTLVKVRESTWPHTYFVKWWTRLRIEEDEWGDYEPGWYEYFPDNDEDGDDIVAPELWWDESGK